MKPTRWPVLGELELAVLEYLWSRAGEDAKTVHQNLGRKRRITLNTIQSTLKRLFEKGLLTRDKISHAHVYTPSLTRAEFHRRALDEVAERLMGSEPQALLSAFMGLTEHVGVEELHQLEELVARRIRELEGGESS